MTREKQEKTYQHAADLFQQQKYAQALALLDHVARSMPKKDRRVVYARARCLGELGRTDEALLLCKELGKRFRDPRGKVLAERLRSKGKRKRTLRPRKRARTRDLPPAEPMLTRKARWALLSAISLVVGGLCVVSFMMFDNTEILARNRVDLTESSVDVALETESQETPAIVTPAIVTPAVVTPASVDAETDPETNNAGEAPDEPVVSIQPVTLCGLHLRGADAGVGWVEKWNGSSRFDVLLGTHAQLQVTGHLENRTALALSRTPEAFKHLLGSVEQEYGFVPSARPMEEVFVANLLRESKQREHKKNRAKTAAVTRKQPVSSQANAAASEEEPGMLMEPLVREGG